MGYLTWIGTPVVRRCWQHPRYEDHPYHPTAAFRHHRALPSTGPAGTHGDPVAPAPRVPDRARQLRLRAAPVARRRAVAPLRRAAQQSRGAGSIHRTASGSNAASAPHRPSGCTSPPRHPSGPPRSWRPWSRLERAARGSTPRPPPPRRPALRARRPLPPSARRRPPPGPLVPLRPQGIRPPPDRTLLALLRYRHRRPRRTTRPARRPARLLPAGAVPDFHRSRSPTSPTPWN